MKEERKKMAQETLSILQQGFYHAPSGKRVDISKSQKTSEEACYLITPDEYIILLDEYFNSETKAENLSKSTELPIEVKNASTVAAIIDSVKNGDPVAVLNFASAKNPGGGFINGSMAQEEALAYSSGLYNTQIRHMEYYKQNRACGKMWYTNHAIFSPNVVFFRDERFRLLETPATASVLTLPAVNMRKVREKGQELTVAEQIMKHRMSFALKMFVKKKYKTVILGAFGCGVFGNNPNLIARWWKELLFNDGYGAFFNKVLFAVLDKPDGENIRVFEHEFNKRVGRL
jgi:uncharacterized protein (TIGR02452 family)